MCVLKIKLLQQHTWVRVTSSKDVIDVQMNDNKSDKNNRSDVGETLQVEMKRATDASDAVAMPTE